MLGKVLIVDTETTDLLTNDPHAEIVEIAAVVLDLHSWRVLSSMHSLVQHTRPMCDFTKKQFADVSFANALPLDYLLESLLNTWTNHGGAWLGQNPMFDLSFVKPAAEKYGLAWPLPPAVDYHPLDLASMMLPYVLKSEVESVSLRNTRIWAGMKGPQSHRACGDVSDVIHVLAQVIARSYSGNITETMREFARKACAGLWNKEEVALPPHFVKGSQR